MSYPFHMRRPGRAGLSYDQHTRFTEEKEARLRDQLEELVEVAISFHGLAAAEAIREMVARALDRHGGRAGDDAADSLAEGSLVP